MDLGEFLFNLNYLFYGVQTSGYRVCGLSSYSNAMANSFMKLEEQWTRQTALLSLKHYTSMGKSSQKPQTGPREFKPRHNKQSFYEQLSLSIHVGYSLDDTMEQCMVQSKGHVEIYEENTE